MENMNVYKIAILVFAFSYLLSGCGGKELKPVPQEVTIADRAIKIVQKIKDAFESGTFDYVRDYVKEDILQKMKSLRDEIYNVKIEFHISWIEIERDTTRVFVKWNMYWQQSDGTKMEKTGIGGFVFSGSPLKLNKIVRDSPFD